MSDRGSKCPAEHWRPAGHFVRQTWNNFREDCNWANGLWCTEMRMWEQMGRFYGEFTYSIQCENLSDQIKNLWTKNIKVSSKFSGNAFFFTIILCSGVILDPKLSWELLSTYPDIFLSTQLLEKITKNTYIWVKSIKNNWRICLSGGSKDPSHVE